MAKKLKKLLRKAAPLLAVAGLGKAFMNARNRRAQNKMFAFEEGGNLLDQLYHLLKDKLKVLIFLREQIYLVSTGWPKT